MSKNIQEEIDSLPPNLQFQVYQSIILQKLLEEFDDDRNFIGEDDFH